MYSLFCLYFLKKIRTTHHHAFLNFKNYTNVRICNTTYDTTLLLPPSHTYYISHARRMSTVLTKGITVYILAQIMRDAHLKTPDF